jgi:flagellar biosynthesis protein FliR
LDLLELLQSQTGFFLLVFARISAICTSAPLFSSRNIPVYTKIGISMCLTYMIVPLLLPLNLTLPEQLLSYVFSVSKEFLLGLIMGFIVSLIFSAVQMTGSLLDIQIGFGIINILDPQSGQQIPLIGNFKYILAIFLFLMINGHHLLLQALLASFKLIPPIHVVYTPHIAQLLVDIMANMFVIALKISMPVLVALILTDVALGILTRTMPQLNIFVVGMPVKIFVGIFILVLALPFYIRFIEGGFNETFRYIYLVLELFGKK